MDLYKAERKKNLAVRDVITACIRKLEKELTDVNDWLVANPSRCHAAHKARKSQSIVMPDRTNNFQLTQKMRAYRSSIRDSDIVNKRWVKFQKPHTNEQYRANVRTFCRIICADSRQKLFHDLVHKRSKEINEMSNYEVTLQWFAMGPSIPDEMSNDEATWQRFGMGPLIPKNSRNQSNEYYVLSGPNTIYLGKTFEIKWRKEVCTLLCLPLIHDLCDLIIQFIA